MRRDKLFVLIFAAIVPAIAGCGGKSETPAATEQPAATVPSPTPDTSSAVATTSPYDSGPRAGEAATNGGMASKGERLFTSKGCVVCHGFGKVITCPDLHGVTMRRTAQWMEQQILHPDVMVKTDPITRELKTHHALPMTNQGLTADEARAVIEFLKKKDRAAGVKGMAS
jgi:mono/diheme cytochrome c family protein